MNPSQLSQILQLAPPGDQILFAVPVGSVVYSTNGPDSDQDFLVVLKETQNTTPPRIIHTRIQPTKPTHQTNQKIDILLQSVSQFLNSLYDGNIFAIECISVPGPLQIVPIPTPVKENYLQAIEKSTYRQKVREQAIEKSNSDWNHAIKSLTQNPNLKSKKQLWHSLRIPIFAHQILSSPTHRVTDSCAANDLWFDILTDPNEHPEHQESLWNPVRLNLLSQLG